MLSVAEITFIIGVFCGIKDPKIKEADKLDCIDFVTNCAIVNGSSTNKLMDGCREMYVEGKRYHERFESGR